jgi:hypothetical protein
MKKDVSKNKLKGKKASKSKKNIKEEKKIEEEKVQEAEEKKHDFTPEIDDVEEEKQFIKENKSNKGDFIPEGILDNNIQEELPSLTGKTKVSLDRMNFQRQGGFNLENFIENSPINQVKKQPWQEEFNPDSYISGIKNSDEPKYLDYDGSFNPIERVNMGSLSAINEQKAKIQFNPMLKQEEKSIETYVPAEKINMSELGKRKSNIVDFSKEIKYAPSKR